ncbi:MAG: hypothetical protein J6J36_00035 [Clostridia bacterium]|nr:hypothetical protein [Clostridia bacterium]
MKILYKELICIILMFCLSFCMIFGATKTYADELNPDTYQPSQSGEIDENFVKKYGGTIKNILFEVGVIVSVIAVMYVGIKYLTIGSLAQKADYKKDMIPMAIGMAIIAMLSFILSIIAGIAASI